MSAVYERLPLTRTGPGNKFNLCLPRKNRLIRSYYIRSTAWPPPASAGAKVRGRRSRRRLIAGRLYARRPPLFSIRPTTTTTSFSATETIIYIYYVYTLRTVYARPRNAFPPLRLYYIIVCTLIPSSGHFFPDNNNYYYYYRFRPVVETYNTRRRLLVRFLLLDFHREQKSRAHHKLLRAQNIIYLYDRRRNVRVQPKRSPSSERSRYYLYRLQYHCCGVVPR